jgi:hypothetical protein
VICLSEITLLIRPVVVRPSAQKFNPAKSSPGIEDAVNVVALGGKIGVWYASRQ